MTSSLTHCKETNICQLPVEVVLHIFSFLTSKDLCRVTMVCQLWKNLGQDHLLWKKLSINNASGKMEKIHLSAIKCLSQRVTRLTTLRADNATHAVLQPFLYNCPTVESLTLERTRCLDPRMMNGICHQFPRLTSLTLDDVWLSPASWTALSSVESLRSVTMSDMYDEDVRKFLLQTKSKLDSFQFSISYLKMLRKTLIPTLTECHMDTLVVVKINAFLKIDSINQFVEYPKLRKLHIQRFQFPKNPQDENNDHFITIFQTLCSKLQCFQLGPHQLREHFLRIFHSRNYLQLKELSFNFTPETCVLPTKEFISLIANACPNLSHFALLATALTTDLPRLCLDSDAFECILKGFPNLETLSISIASHLTIAPHFQSARSKLSNLKRIKVYYCGNPQHQECEALYIKKMMMKHGIAIDIL